MSTQSPLAQLQQIFADEKIPCSPKKREGSHAIDKLIITLGRDYKNRERTLEIAVQEQFLNPDDSHFEKHSHKHTHSPEPLPKKSLDSYVRLQFYTLLPFHVKDLALPEVSSLLLFLNRTLELPGFELNELENEVNYRNVLLVYGGTISKNLILSILGVVMMLLDLFTETIENIGEGTKTFNDLLEEIVKMSEQLSDPKGL